MRIGYIVAFYHCNELIISDIISLCHRFDSRAVTFSHVWNGFGAETELPVE